MLFNVILQNEYTSILPVDASRVKITCFDVSSSYIVVGSNSGTLYTLDHDHLNVIAKCPTHNREILEISINSDESQLAFASDKGIVHIAEVPGQRKKKVYRSTCKYHENAIITALLWGSRQNLFIGDEKGRVSVYHVPTNLTSSVLLNLTTEILCSISPIIQLDYCCGFLSVATKSNIYICDTKLETFSLVEFNDDFDKCAICFDSAFLNKNEVLDQIRNPSDFYKYMANINFSKLPKEINDKVTKAPGALYPGRSLIENLTNVTSNKQPLNLEIKSPTGFFCIESNLTLRKCNLSGYTLTVHHFENSNNPVPVIQVAHNVSDVCNSENNLKVDQNQFIKIIRYASYFLMTVSDNMISLINPSNFKVIFQIFAKGVENIKTHSDLIFYSCGNHMHKCFLTEIDKTILNLFFKGFYDLCAKLCLKYPSVLKTSDLLSKFYSPLLQKLMKKLKDSNIARSIKLIDSELNNYADIGKLKLNSNLDEIKTREVQKRFCSNFTREETSNQNLDHTNLYFFNFLQCIFHEIYFNYVSNITELCSSEDHRTFNPQIHLAMEENSNETTQKLFYNLHILCEKTLASKEKILEHDNNDNKISVLYSWLKCYHSVSLLISYNFMQHIEGIIESLQFISYRQFIQYNSILILMCMQYGICFSIDSENVLDQHHLTPQHIKKLDCFFAHLITNSSYFIDCSCILDNLHRVEINLFFLTWCSLLTEIYKSYSWTNSSIKYNGNSRSDKLLYLKDSCNLNNLEQLSQIFGAMENDSGRGIYDLIYFIMKRKISVMGPVILLYLQEINKNYKFYSLYTEIWIHCKEIQYEIILTLLSAVKDDTAKCSCGFPRPSVIISPLKVMLDNIFALPIEPSSLCLELCTRNEYFHGVIALKACDALSYLNKNHLPHIVQSMHKYDIIYILEIMETKDITYLLLILSKIFNEDEKYINCFNCKKILLFLCSSDDQLKISDSIYNIQNSSYKSNFTTIFEVWNCIIPKVFQKLGCVNALFTVKSSLDFLSPKLLTRIFYRYFILSAFAFVKNLLFEGAFPKLFYHHYPSVISSEILLQVKNELMKNQLSDSNLNELFEYNISEERKSPRLLPEILPTKNYSIPHTKFSSHWGIYLNILEDVCVLCHLGLIVENIVSLEGLFIYPCGHAVHGICSKERKIYDCQCKTGLKI